MEHMVIFLHSSFLNPLHQKHALFPAWPDRPKHFSVSDFKFCLKLKQRKCWKKNL